MIILYAVLTIFLGITGYFSYEGFYNSAYVNSMAQNIFSEIFGIIVTLALVDKIFDLNEEKENKRMQQIALKYLRTEIAKYLRMLLRLYKASVEERYAKKIGANTIEEFFDEDYFSTIVHLNHNKKVPDITEDYTYLEYIKSRCDDLKSAIEKTLKLHEKYFPSEIVEKMDDLMECDFMKIVNIIDRSIKLKTKPYCDLNNLFDNDDTVLAAFKWHMSKFIWLVNYYEKITKNSNPIELNAEAWGVRPVIFAAGLDSTCARDPKTEIRKTLNSN